MIYLLQVSRETSFSLSFYQVIETFVDVWEINHVWQHLFTAARVASSWYSHGIYDSIDRKSNNVLYFKRYFLYEINTQ